MSKNVIENQNGEPTDLQILEVPASKIKNFSPTWSNNRASDLARLEEADSIKSENCLSAVVRYWEAEKGDKKRFVFKGFKILNKVEETSGEVKDLPAAFLRAKDGDFINASTVVVEACLGLSPDTIVEIICTGKKGRMKTFDVTIIA